LLGLRKAAPAPAPSTHDGEPLPAIVFTMLVARSRPRTLLLPFSATTSAPPLPPLPLTPLGR
jgi:hypothetical protein